MSCDIVIETEFFEEYYQALCIYLVLCKDDKQTTTIIHQSKYDHSYVWELFQKKVQTITNVTQYLEEALNETGIMKMFFAFARVMKLCDKL